MPRTVSHYDIPMPSDREVALTCAENNHKFASDTAAIRSLIDIYPSHTNLNDVLLKVAIINQLYRTNILGVHDVAQTIIKNGLDLPTVLEAGNCAAVDLIRITDHSGKEIDHYSFATKYCHLHKPALFPIFDTRVERALKRLREKTEFCSVQQLRDLRNYASFRAILEALRVRFSLSCSVLDLDRFLYLHGEPT